MKMAGIQKGHKQSATTIAENYYQKGICKRNLYQPTKIISKIQNQIWGTHVLKSLHCCKIHCLCRDYHNTIYHKASWVDNWRKTLEVIIKKIISQKLREQNYLPLFYVILNLSGISMLQEFTGHTADRT